MLGNKLLISGCHCSTCCSAECATAHAILRAVCINVRRVNARLCLSCAQKAENIAYVAGELFSGGGTPSLRSVFRSVSRTLRAPSTPHHKHNQARQAGRFCV